MSIKLSTREIVKLAASRHYRVCAYCGKREYGENIGKLMELTSYGRHDRSESHFAHKTCPKDEDGSKDRS